MKKLLAFILMFGMLFATVSCGRQTEICEPETKITSGKSENDEQPGVLSMDFTESGSAGEETTAPTCAEDGQQISFSAVAVSVNGNSVELYHEMLYMMSGSYVADGRLMFQTVSEVLPKIAEIVPAVSLDSSTQIKLWASGDADIGLSSKYKVYDSDWQFLLETESLQEIYALRESVLKEKEVYVYFTVSLTYSSVRQCEGYFFKVDFEGA